MYCFVLCANYYPPNRLDSEQISEESEKGVVDHEMEIEVDRNVGVEA